MTLLWKSGTSFKNLALGPELVIPSITAVVTQVATAFVLWGFQTRFGFNPSGENPAVIASAGNAPVQEGNMGGRGTPDRLKESCDEQSRLTGQRQRVRFGFSPMSKGTCLPAHRRNARRFPTSAFLRALKPPPIDRTTCSWRL